MNDNNAQEAVFIDYDNIEISVTDTLGKDVEVEWKKILEEASKVGRTVMRRAYADWAAQSGAQRDLLGLGIDLVHVSSKRGKNAADIRIVIDALEMLQNPISQVTHVLLVSGDGDFTELVHRLRAGGLDRPDRDAARREHLDAVAVALEDGQHRLRRRRPAVDLHPARHQQRQPDGRPADLHHRHAALRQSSAEKSSGIRKTCWR